MVFTGIPSEKLKLKLYFEGSSDVALGVSEVDLSEWFYLTYLNFDLSINNNKQLIVGPGAMSLSICAQHQLSILHGSQDIAIL